jgi:D-xylose 1-dehydrogenase (NADP+, D-xylono-1,5-lactone-forming)
MQSGQTPSHTPVGWGVLSTANIGVKHVAPAIHKSANGRLVAVGSRDPQRVRRLYTFAPNVRVHSNYESLIQDPQVEAIYNPLPNSLHAEWSIKAMNAGKHVLCEKPLSVTAEEAASMVQVARANGVLLMEAFMYRFHPQTVWALEQVAAGRIGPVRLVRSSFSFDIRSRPNDVRLQPALGGGSLMDVGCYPVNLCRAVYGHAPIAVAARVYTHTQGEVELAANAVLDFGDGRYGLIDSSFGLPARQAAEIIGETGTITILMPFRPLDAGAVALLTVDDQTTEQRFASIDQYQLQVEHFASCIRSGQQPALRLEETLENMATIEAIYRSAGFRWPLV